MFLENILAIHHVLHKKSHFNFYFFMEEKRFHNLSLLKGLCTANLKKKKNAAQTAEAVTVLNYSARVVEGNCVHTANLPHTVGPESSLQ